MREIEYQAWHQYQLQMFQVTALQWDAAISRKFSKIELLSLDGLYTVRTVTGAACDNYLLREYTGLKDKHGKEIYEGDIVTASTAHDPCYTGPVRSGVVDIYVDGLNVRVCGFYVQTPIDSTYLYLLEEMCDGRVEIIGNIYEHPELLEVK